MKNSLVPADVLAQYDIGPIGPIRSIERGLIHATFLVRGGKEKYILQRLHPVLATPEIAADFFAVTEHLAQKRFPAPCAVLTRDGFVTAETEELVWPQFPASPTVSVRSHFNGGAPRPETPTRRVVSWRMQTWIPGKTITRMTTPSQAAATGKALARFHRAMADFPATFQSKKVLHDTPAVFERFVNIARQFHRDPLAHRVEAQTALVLRELPRLLLPSRLPLRVIHGDPKISNFLFDAHGQVSAIVDLDTCNRRSVLVELGDAFRSWCGTREDASNNAFSAERFVHGWRSYRAAARGLLTARERALVLRATKLITLELTTRFLTDYFLDEYFGWDPKRYPNRRAHNLARVDGQIALFSSLKQQEQKLERFV